MRTAQQEPRQKPVSGKEAVQNSKRWNALTVESLHAEVTNSSGNPAIRGSCEPVRTGGFASPSLDGYALV